MYIENNTMYRLGDRIELIEMPNDPHPIPAGTQGTILKMGPDPCSRGYHIFSMKWDNGRTLNLCDTCDSFKKVG